MSWATKVFLALERRQHLAYYKLRFRRTGRQIVRYVGGTEAAALVADELKTLQNCSPAYGVSWMRLAGSVFKMLRNAKLELAPLASRARIQIFTAGTFEGYVVL